MSNGNKDDDDDDNDEDEDDADDKVCEVGGGRPGNWRLLAWIDANLGASDLNFS